MNENIMAKVWNKQASICTNFDLTEYGYGKRGKQNGKIKWENEDFNLVRKHRNQVRKTDLIFFKRLCGSVYMKKWELDHDWDNGEIVTLKTPEEHRNDKNGKYKQIDNFVETEKWLQELYPGKRQ